MSNPNNHPKINAMIFAAGFGSRLKPLTDHRPKALVEVAGMPLLEIALRKMERLGIPKVVVNVHHHADQMFDFLNHFKSSQMEVLISHEQDQILDTGGGLLKARHLFDAQASILLYNVDILTNANLNKFIESHLNANHSVSLMVKHRKASRFLLFDDQMHLAGWRQADGSGETRLSNKQTLKPFGFQGIHIIKPSLFDHMTEQGSFPIVPFYLRVAGELPIVGYESADSDWFDIGTPKKLAVAEAYLKSHTQSEYRSFF